MKAEEQRAVCDLQNKVFHHPANKSRGTEQFVTYRIKFFIIQLGEHSALDLLRFEWRPVEDGQAELRLDFLLDRHSCTQPVSYTHLTLPTNIAV